MNAFRRAVKAVEETPMSLGQWLTGFAGILFVRFLLEEFSTAHSVSGVASTDAATLVHFVLFFIVAALSIVLSISLFAPEKRHVAPKVALFGLMIVWISPLIDMAIGHEMAYHFALPGELLRDFLTFFGPLTGTEITLGLRIELALIVLGVFSYVRFIARIGTLPSLAVAFVSYVAIFALMALPSVAFALASLFAGSGLPVGGVDHPVMNYVSNVMRESLVAKNFLHPTLLPFPLDRQDEIRFVAFFSQALYALLALLALAYTRLAFPSKLAAVLRNSRPERVAHYSLLIAAGMMAAAASSPLRFPLGPEDALSIALVFVSFYFAWMYAVGVNDIEDVDIDAVSNSSRPLISGELSESDVKGFNLFFIIMSLAGAYLAGHYVLFTLLVFTAAYFIYSARPLKLKRVPLVAPFLISVACLTAAMAGFFTLSADPRITAFPDRWAVFVLVAFTLAAHMKDLKDIEGDRAAGIPTFAVLLGSRAKPVIGAMLGLSFFSVPAILDLPMLYTTAFPASLAAFTLVNQRDFREIRIFILYFAFAAASFLVYYV